MYFINACYSVFVPMCMHTCSSLACSHFPLQCPAFKYNHAVHKQPMIISQCMVKYDCNIMLAHNPTVLKSYINRNIIHLQWRVGCIMPELIKNIIWCKSSETLSVSKRKGWDHDDDMYLKQCYHQTCRERKATTALLQLLAATNHQIYMERELKWIEDRKIQLFNVWVMTFLQISMVN